MAKSTSGQVTKIYELRTLGYDELMKQLTAVSAKFETIKKAKQSTEGKIISTQDINEVKKYAEELSKLAIQEKSLKVETQRLAAEIKAEQLVRQQAINASKLKQQQNNAEIGSIKALRNEIRELNNAVINRTQGGDVNFKGQILSYNEAIAKLQELTTAEQNFRRQFAQDRLLVGEYTSGIVQAFKSMGLNDLIGGQITKASQRLNDLDSDFEQLKQELSQVGVTGEGNLQKIETQLIENRKEAIALKAQVGQLQAEFRGAGDVGNQITASISKGFQSLKGQVASFALQYIGLQAVFNQVSNQVTQGIGDAKQIEGVTAAFNRLNDPNLLANLRAATRGTVSDLKLMQITVQATNFQIPQEQLGFLLDFARRRAKETGQEVDFLVESIITGIGRKSPLILDNLGISAVRLREKLKGIAEENANVGDVATAVSEIIQEENRKAGAEVDTLGEKIQVNEAQWRNLRLEFTQRLLPALVTVGTIFIGLIANLPVILSLVALLTAGWALANTQLVLQNAQLLYYNLLIARNYVALGLLSVLQVAYNGILILGTAALNLFNAGLRAIGVSATISSGPLGVILGLISLLATAYAAFGTAIDRSINSLTDFQRRQRINIETLRAANGAIGEQTSKLDVWMQVIKSAATSTDTKRLALQKLIDINPAFRDALQGQTIDLQKLDAAYRGVTDAIRAKALAEAAASLAAEKQKKVLQLSTLRQRLETETAIQNPTNRGSRTITVRDLSDEEKNILVGGLFTGSDLVNNTSLRDAGGGKISFFAKDIAEIIKFVGKRETEAIDLYKQYLENQAAKESELLALQAKVNSQVGGQAFEVDIAALRATIERLNKEIDGFQGSQADLNKKILERRQAQAQLDKLLGTEKSTGGSLAKSDPFKVIDARRDQQLADEETRRLRDQISEEDYLKNILAINQKAIDDKLALVRGATAEEQKLRSQLTLERVKLETDTNEKLQDLAQKQFDAIVADLKRQKEEAVRVAEDAADVVANDPTATETQRATARLSADQAILQAEENFGRQLDLLEQQIGLRSVQNAQQTAEEVRRIKLDIINDQRDVSLATLDDIEAAGRKSIAEFQAIISAQRLRVQQSNLSPRRRTRALDALGNEEEVGVLAREVASLQQQLPVYKALLAKKKITDEAYFEFVAKLNAKQEERNNKLGTTAESSLNKIRDLKSGLQAGLQDILNIKPGSDEDQLLSQVINQSYDLARDAMNSYFDSEEQRVRDNLNIQLERLDLEKEQVKSRARSAAEIESIDKQYAARKKAEERRAGEELKNIRKKEAKLAFAAELANIAVAAAGNPANAATFGVSGAIMYALLAAIAAGRYALRVGEINRTQFEYGGQPGVVPLRGGEFGGNPHSRGGAPFTFKGQQYNAEVDELSVIRTKNASRSRIYNVIGTQRQIASAMNVAGGGVPFATGATLRYFENGGNLGESLQAPVFLPTINSIQTAVGVTKEDLQELAGGMYAIAEAQAARIDRMEVYQVTDTVTAAQKKLVKQNAIGEL